MYKPVLPASLGARFSLGNRASRGLVSSAALHRPIRIAAFTPRPTFPSLPVTATFRRSYTTTSPNHPATSASDDATCPPPPVAVAAPAPHTAPNLAPLLLAAAIAGGYFLLNDGTSNPRVVYNDAEGSRSDPVALASAYHHALGGPGSLTDPTALFTLPSVETLLQLDPQIAMDTKSTSELLVSMLVYQTCALDSLTNHAADLLHLLDRAHLSPAAYWFIRRTFFAHFCGGETHEEVVDTMQRLRHSSVGAMLDLAIEVDLDESGNQSDEREARRAWNQRADTTAELFQKCISTCGAHPGSFAAVKITGISTPQLLQRLSSLKYGLRQLFAEADRDGDGRLTFEEFHGVLRRLPGFNQQDERAGNALTSELWKAAAQANGGTLTHLDWVDFDRTVSISHPPARALFTTSQAGPRLTYRAGPYMYQSLDEDDLADYDATLRRAMALGALADKHYVRLAIDAEQTYFQPAIDQVTFDMSRRYNRLDDTRGPLIFNTYQMYLKDGLPRLRDDYERSRRDGYRYGVKLVRGAYMVNERKRAQALGLPDPISESLEATHASFNGGVRFLVDEIHRLRTAAANAKSPDTVELPPALLVASHNQDSVKLACALMARYQIPADAGAVMFGQLMGMQDSLTYSLGNQGYRVYKYIPYGPVHEVMPYLIRRAQENSSLMGGVHIERQQLWSELRNRIANKLPVARSLERATGPSSHSERNGGVATETANTMAAATTTSEGGVSNVHPGAMAYSLADQLAVVSSSSDQVSTAAAEQRQ
ncbi:proline dehydrogenase [Tieghemiomyces parasiticus]|uniref:Proline dehydrogenase n=1 Tax=Tieghemiomyces parasiticus TaxID=78921 RepID=A0A9W8DTG7_9FUNG|nr:proline dehydrogenase [Tieghemiomyces parasiticus]